MYMRCVRLFLCTIILNYIEYIRTTAHLVIYNKRKDILYPDETGQGMSFLILLRVNQRPLIMLC